MLLKALISAFNKEKALVGASSEIYKSPVDIFKVQYLPDLLIGFHHKRCTASN